jgi:type I restriction enzyme S subunit
MKDTPYTADRLLALYDQVAEAEDAIPRLRRFVLDLAVRGKLVEQDPSDEPAAELLKRIAKEKARLVKAKAIRSPKPQEPIEALERSCALPRGNWAWARLNDMGRLSGGMTPSMNRHDYWGGKVIWLSPKDIKSNEVSTSELKITELGLAETRLEAYPVGCLFIVARSGILKRTLPVAINRQPAASNQDLKVLVPYLNGMERYLQIMLSGFEAFILKDLVKTGTTVQSLKYDEFQRQPFPIPPLAEQQRIVAKVDDLMTLCDQLEQARAGRDAVRDRLTAATWARLTAPETDAETFPTHACFALHTLHTLTTRPSQIKTLRQTILNLAMRGKLVEQDPNDESAGKLLAQDIPLPAGYKRRRKILKASAVDASQGLLGPVPATWSYLTIQDLFDQNVVVDYADGNHGSLYPRSSEFGSDGVNFISAKDLSDGRVNWQTCSKLNEARASQLAKGWAKTGDVLLTHNATVGRVARVIEEVEPFLLGTSVTFYRLNPIALNSSYFYYVLQSPVWQGQLEAIMAQTTRNQVSIQKQASFFVPLPPLAEQHRIVAKVDALMALCDQLESSLNIATTARSRLLEALLHEELGSTLASEAA